MPSVSETGYDAASVLVWRGPGHLAGRCDSSDSAHWLRLLQPGPAPETVRSPRWCSGQPDDDDDNDDDDDDDT